ncbi:MAG: EAL domain-containing protein [Erysipelotrichaceae bacterium]|nr:EAL domain-containing protein [Erysipelotrichaceae bacterium]
MESSHEAVFDDLKTFIEILFENKDSIKALSTAFSFVADDLHIGRIMGEIPSSKSESEMAALAENRILYMSDLGFDPENSYRFSFKTITGADGAMIVSPVPNYTFTDLDKKYLDLLLQISDIHINRCVAYSEIEESSMIQVLTKLPNADGYMKRASHKLAMGSIDEFDSFYFDLSNFGLINKKFGSKEGNEIMVRYTEQLKKFFNNNEVLGHLGGDNFVCLVEKGERSKQLQKMLTEGIIVEGRQPDGSDVELNISAVAGFMHIVMPITRDRIIAGPAIALANAKTNKKKIVELTDEISDAAIRSKSIEQSFENALANNEFTVFYQPKVNSVTGEIIGCEALSRWYENDVLVKPMTYIPVLEKTGKINTLDLFMLETVCKDISEWKKTGRKAVPCSVNFSRRDLLDEKLPRKILDIINRYGVEKSEIVIEVTETASEEESANMINFLGRLSDFGIETSIDDFGTGYSSLSTLREYPINEIKIDRSFINKNLGSSDEIIIHSIIEMAKQLNISVITEGVEKIFQKDFLHKLGCDRLQGYLYDKPLPKEQFEKKLLVGKYNNVTDFEGDD